VKDRGALRAALDAEVAVLTGGAGRPAPDDLRAALKAGITSMRQHLGPDHFVEIGIGCEACHGGSRQHVDDPTLRPSFLPKSPFLEARPADGRREIGHAEAVNRACARCHQVLFSRYPYTWEGGQRHGAKPPGGSHVNSGEARDLLLGGCSRSMSCSTCHDPHAADRPEALAALATPAGNATCTTCHPRYATPEAVRAHTHHDPRGAGGVCLNCHMPRKNVALDYRLTRYHRVGSPTEPAKVLGDRPLECALCHPQDSTERLVDAMERFWGKRYDRAALRALYGDLRRPILAATLARGLPHEQLVAIGVAREQGRRELLPLLVPQLVHRLPLVRHHALAAVNALRERPCDVDLDRQTEAVVAAAQACLPPGARWLAPNRAPDPVEPDEDD
jgi:predicted CXXCH cytochrome family protein